VERRHDETLGVGVLAGAVDPHAGGGAVALDVLEHGSHGDVVGFEQRGIPGETPPHRQGLRRREGAVEAGHGGYQPAPGVVAVDQCPAQPCPRPGVVARKKGLESVGRHRPGQAEAIGLPAQPIPLAVRSLLGQVAGVVARRGPGRVGVDGRHPQHGSPPPPAGTCLT
jgi:hypothetical protein